MRLVGHRGAPYAAPESTLASFSAALALGVQGLEFDVHRTADGRLAVIHDETVDRTTNGVGRVADLTLEDIQRLRIEGGERVPSMEEVLDLVAGKAFLHVELKAPEALAPVVALLRARRLLGEVRLSSFWHGAMLEARGMEPALETGVIFSAAPVRPARLAQEAAANAVHVCHPYVTEGLVAEARAAGLRVLAWTVDGALDVLRVAKLGVDDLVTNDPGMALKVLAEPPPGGTPREKTAEDLRRDAERAAIQALMAAKPGEAEGPRGPGRRPSW